MVHSLIWWFPKPTEDNHIFDTFWVESKNLSARRYGLFIVQWSEVIKDLKSNGMTITVPLNRLDSLQSKLFGALMAYFN